MASRVGGGSTKKKSAFTGLRQSSSSSSSGSRDLFSRNTSSPFNTQPAPSARPAGPTSHPSNFSGTEDLYLVNQPSAGARSSSGAKGKVYVTPDTRDMPKRGAPAPKKSWNSNAMRSAELTARQQKDRTDVQAAVTRGDRAATADATKRRRGKKASAYLSGRV